MSIFSHIRHTSVSFLNTFKRNTSEKYGHYVLLGLLMSIGGFAGYFGRNYYIQHREEKACMALLEIVDAYDQAMYQAMAAQNDEMKQTAFADVNILLHVLYEKHASSYLAPYFLFFKAQILLDQEGSLSEALALMDHGLALVPKYIPFYDAFYLKRTLMALDSDDQTVKQQAYDALVKESRRTDNYVFDEACYMLGLYHMSQEQDFKAKEAFEYLVQHTDKKDLFVSPWVALAEEKVESL